MYTVLWIEEAEEELAQLWLADDSNEVARVVNQINETLEKAPLDAGESRSGNERILFLPPLAVRFLVEEAKQEVSVTSIWSIRK